MKRLEKTYIYVLKDPNTLEIRYVGKANEPIKRFSKHIRDCFNNKQKNTHKQNWIRKLLDGDPNNFKDRPLMEIIEEVEYSKWKEREVFWINKLRNDGYHLTNVEDGGNGHDPTTCKKVARINYITNEIEEIYESISEAGRRNDYSSHARISDCCHGKTQLSMGYIWRFLDKDNNIIDNTFRDFKSKKVAKLNLELDIVKIYPTLSSVREDYDCSNVYNVCKGNTRSESGYIWRFLDKDNNIINPKISYKLKTISKYDLDGNYIKTYLNSEIAASEHGLKSGQSIRNCLGDNFRTSCGYIWKYNNY